MNLGLPVRTSSKEAFVVVGDRLYPVRLCDGLLAAQGWLKNLSAPNLPTSAPGLDEDARVEPMRAVDDPDEVASSTVPDASFSSTTRDESKLVGVWAADGRFSRRSLAQLNLT